ncbi:Glycosyltransferase involved in cell wall bisynthesis [Flavobacterium succinicans]|uniref:Glycosyltransferase involved in cell wall bisynthesis n=1 Tax=Flavobacterium succinicans TaxID=29536 RepID=A0A1I4XU38_9FLAO|nr:glycosyltransferase family 4 protein [Flavobacterium succinicans]SFN28799.1 Glycosyltransferase involved in cell wall bisynthesis [Flavobacterium succinicans]
MKLLYLIPSVNNAGGVAKILSLKTHYFIEKWGYEIHVVTQNEGHKNPFFDFHPTIVWHDIERKGQSMKAVFQYKKQLKELALSLQPDSIIVADNGLKAYLVPFLLNKKIPIVFECHGSKYQKEAPFSISFLNKMKYNYTLWFKEWAAKQFDAFVVLNAESAKEWPASNCTIITNPLVIRTSEKKQISSKRVVAIARNAYEKGLDRLLVIWQQVAKLQPEWELCIYGVLNPETQLLPLAQALGVESSVTFYPPVVAVETVYLDSAVFVMTSRYEGLGLVLLEAMASGLPCVAYDCPVGPRSIITDGVNGFLVEDGNVDAFVERLVLLFQDEKMRKTMGENAQKSIANYELNTIMHQWKALFDSLIIQR